MRLTKVQNASYWERVAMMAETQDQAEISYIQENECEDDFKIALASRSDATAEQLAWCADTSSIKAQGIVLAHENVNNETIVLIATNSVDTYKDNIGHASYVHPMQGYHKKMVELSQETFKIATIVAQRKSVPWLTAGDAMAMLTDDYHLNAPAEQTAMDTVRDYIDSIIDHTKTVDAWVQDFKTVMGNDEIMKLAFLRQELSTLVSAYMLMEELVKANKPSMAGECLEAYAKTALGITMPIRKFW